MAVDIISEIAVRLGLDTDGLANDVKNTNKVIKELNKEFKYLDKGAKGSQNELDRLGDITKTLNSKLDVTRNAFKEVQNTISQTQKEIDRLIQEKKQLIQQGQEESNAYKEVEQRIKEYSSAMEQAKRDAIQLGGVISSTEKQVQKYGNQFKQTERALEVFGKVANETGTDVKELARQLNIDIDVADFKQLQNALREIKQDANNLSSETRQLIDNITDVGNRARNSSRDLDRMSESLDQISRNTRLEVIGDGVDALSDAFGDMGRSITGFGKESVLSFAEFERTVVGGVMKTEEGIKGLDSAMTGLQELGAKFPVTNAELATSFDDLAASGFSVKDSLAILEGSLNTSMATGEELNAIVSATSSSYALFSDQVGSVAELQDVMANAANLGKISFEELGKQLVKVGGNANNLGMDVEDVSAILAELSNEGLTAEASGEKLNSMLRQLGNPSKKAKEELADLGVKVFDSEGKFRGFTTVMGELNEATKGMTDEQKNLTMATLFGADASSAASSFMEKGIDNTNKYGETLKSTKGYVDELTKAISDNAEASSAITQLEGAFDSLKATVGEALVPLLTTLAPIVTNLITSFNEANPTIQTLVITILGIIGVVGVLLSVLAPIIFSITSLITVFGGASAVVGVLGAAFTFITGPIGLAIAAIVAIIAIGIALVKNWDTVKASCSKVWESIKTSISNAWNAIKPIVTQGANTVKNTVSNVFNSVKSFVDSVWNGIKNAINTAWSGIKTVVKTGADLVKSTVSRVFNTLENIITAPFKAAKKVIDSIFGGISKSISSITSAINKVTNKSSKATSTFNATQSVSSDIEQPFDMQPLNTQTFYDNLSNVKTGQASLQSNVVERNGAESAKQLAVATSNLGIITALQQQNKLLMDIITNTDAINNNTNNLVQDVVLTVDGKQIASATARHMKSSLDTIGTRANRLGAVL